MLDVQLWVRVSEDMKEQLEKIAKKEGYASNSELIRTILRLYLSKKRQQYDD